MIDYVLIALGLAWWSAAVCICWKMGRYFGKLIAFRLYARNAPDCCMCGASNPNQCDNHAYTPQMDWYLQGHHPQAY